MNDYVNHALDSSNAYFIKSLNGQKVLKKEKRKL